MNLPKGISLRTHCETRRSRDSLARTQFQVSLGHLRVGPSWKTALTVIRGGATSSANAGKFHGMFRRTVGRVVRVAGEGGDFDVLRPGELGSALEAPESTSQKATLAPSAPRLNTIARPMPAAPPVPTTTLFCKLMTEWPLWHEDRNSSVWVASAALSLLSSEKLHRSRGPVGWLEYVVGAVITPHPIIPAAPANAEIPRRCCVPAPRWAHRRRRTGPTIRPAPGPLGRL